MLWICNANLRMLHSLHRMMVASTWACVVMLDLHLGLLLLLQLLVSSCYCLLEVPCVQDQASFFSLCSKACVVCCPCWLVLRYHIKLTVEPVCCDTHFLYVTVETVLKGPDVEPHVGGVWRCWFLTKNTNQPTNQPTSRSGNHTKCITLPIYFLQNAVAQTHLVIPKGIQMLFSRSFLLLNKWLIGSLGWWFGFLGSPYERDCYLGAPRFESQTTNPNHQFSTCFLLPSFTFPYECFRK